MTKSPLPQAGAGMPLRDYRIHRYVNVFCPHCHTEDPDRPLEDVRRLSGWLAVRGTKVYLERGCPDHGFVRTLYDESAEILAYLEEWTAPTKEHVADVSGNFAPVPSAYTDGLPHMQTQHTCILLEDITDHCNLRCPTCFADSAGVDRDRADERGAGFDRHPALTGAGPDRRADALRRRAHPAPRLRRVVGGDRGSAGHPDPDQQQRSEDRPGRRAVGAAGR